MIIKRLPMFFLLSLFSGSVIAETSEAREIKSIGCNVKNNWCFVSISGAPMGPASCKKATLFYNADYSHSVGLINLISMAFQNNKKAIFKMKDKCIGSDPEISRVTIQK